MTRYGTDEGFRAAMAQANRVRLRTIGTAACAAALALMVSGSAVTPRATGESRLDVVTTPDPVPPAPGAAPTSGPLPTAVTGSPAAGARPPAAVAPVARQPAAENEDVAGSPANLARRPQSTVMTRSRGGSAPQEVLCTVSSGAGWCFAARPGFREGPAHVWALQAGLCGSGVDAVSAHFATTAEVELAILDEQGRVLWSYLADHPAVHGPHDVTVNSSGSGCVEWTAKWFQRTNAGAAVPAGQYRLVARLLATDPSLPQDVVTFRIK